MQRMMRSQPSPRRPRRRLPATVVGFGLGLFQYPPDSHPVASSLPLPNNTTTTTTATSWQFNEQTYRTAAAAAGTAAGRPGGGTHINSDCVPRNEGNLADSDRNSSKLMKTTNLLHALFYMTILHP